MAVRNGDRTACDGFGKSLQPSDEVVIEAIGAVLRRAEFGYVWPGTPKFYFEGITFASQEGAVQEFPWRSFHA